MGRDKTGIVEGQRLSVHSAPPPRARHLTVENPLDQENDIAPLPSLEKVQEHIQRVREIVGGSYSQGVPTPAPCDVSRPHTALTSPRSRNDGRKLTAHLNYTVPFPELKRRREGTKQGERLLHAM